jgi:hypothetical protein
VWWLCAAAVLTVGCAGTTASLSAGTYEEAKSRYLAALESDVRARGFPHARLVPIPPTSEPFKPGASFKKDSAKPAAFACILSEKKSPESLKVRELWASGSPARFAFDGEIPDMLKAATQQIPAVTMAVTKDSTAIVSLADTTQLSLKRNDLIPVLRNEPCLNALVGYEVMMVQGIIYGAEAVSNGRYLEVGAHQETFKSRRYRVMYDGAGGYYLQEAEPKPRYWILSLWRLDVQVQKEVRTPEERLQALRAFLTSNGGTLTVEERTPSDHEVHMFLETLESAPQKR